MYILQIEYGADHWARQIGSSNMTDAEAVLMAQDILGDSPIARVAVVARLLTEERQVAKWDLRLAWDLGIAAVKRTEK